MVCFVLAAAQDVFVDGHGSTSHRLVVVDLFDCSATLSAELQALKLIVSKSFDRGGKSLAGIGLKQ
jgi:hypothetical protein